MRQTSRLRSLFAALLAALATFAASARSADQPAAPGKLVDLGGNRLHINCTGSGAPTVVIENGLGDFSFDWILVQSQVSAFARICTYDRSGYAWSDPGPLPRTFAQINLELYDALAKLGERGPYILVGHSYGGPVVRNFALTYPTEVAGIVFVDAAFEGMRVGIGGKNTMRLGTDAKNRAIPPPHEKFLPTDKAEVPAGMPPLAPQPLDPMYKVLPADQQKMRLWAQTSIQLELAEYSQREWSSEYFARWLATPQQGTLGKIPVLVLTRAEGGYHDGDTDVPAPQLEKERLDGQNLLVRLSSNSKQIFVHSGHNMNLEAPAEVTSAIRKLAYSIRNHSSL